MNTDYKNPTHNFTQFFEKICFNGNKHGTDSKEPEHL